MGTRAAGSGLPGQTADVRDHDQIRRFLRSSFDWEVDEIEEVGRGAWSTAYRFDADGRALVIRVGAHVEDFQADRAAAAFRSSALPIPDVLHVGAFGEVYCCVSTFAPGTPLESCSAAEWAAVVASLVDALEAMRGCRSGRRGRTWSEVLLAVNDDHSGTRLEGWRDGIARSPEASAALDASMSQLRSIDAQIGLGTIEPTLTHGDLVNRNAHMADGVVTGIFDWGCMRWGDHLYDLAWFEFWSPWNSRTRRGIAA